MAMIMRSEKRKKPARRAATLVLAVVLLTLLLGMVAFAVDLGYIVLVRTQLQVAADSAAMSGTAKIVETGSEVVETAQYFADRHSAGNCRVALNADDVEFGHWSFATRVFDSASATINALRVTTRRDETSGGEAPLFFARVLGKESHAVTAQAVAAFVDNFGGFRVPPDKNLQALPFALKKSTCEEMLAGNGSDDWGWDPESGRVTPGGDGIAEVILFPQATGAAGNFGTVDIGNPNNSTADLARQIRDGISAADLDYIGGSLELDEHGTLELNGDPGISAGIEDELASICGEPRIICVYDQVAGPGNNAQYRIVQFVGVCIMEVTLTGNKSDKRVVIQPARVVTRGGIPDDGPTPRSRYIVSSVCLVR